LLHHVTIQNNPKHADYRLADEYDGAQQRGEVQKHGGQMRADLFDVPTTVDNEKHIHSDRPSGTSIAAALRRLRKDRPDIHQRVLAS
jgi:hypothetical protein